MHYDVIIIGGGVSGIGAALTFGSTLEKGMFEKELKILLIDNDKSDLKKARLYNVPLAGKGVSGSETLERMREELKGFDNITTCFGSAVKAEGTKGDFRVILESGDSFTGKYVVLATGFRAFEIQGLGVDILPNEFAPKPGLIRARCKENGLVKEGVYVAGILSGIPTMYACALGSGVRIACEILSDMQGKVVVVHDIV